MLYSQNTDKVLRSSHRRKTIASHKFGMVWLYLSPILVGRRGVFYSFKLYLPAFTALRGRGVESATYDNCQVLNYIMTTSLCILLLAGPIQKWYVHSIIFLFWPMQADSRQLYARPDLPDGLLASASGRCQVFRVVFECRRFNYRRCAGWKLIIFLATPTERTLPPLNTRNKTEDHHSQELYMYKFYY